ncbi:hypothetical protein Ae168Ps1_0494 [Pseudonocardia sp. Ae168_Ps1]|uniref:DUF1059 domain-containing protein n=1 Tax=unclassified Pseudonocardia TaxID=2619320 RepID=UPI0001FFEA05|nr:hypothetical protein Ae150APs1_0499 [Pseudonocardia sp. Ae150A_Ps1]OLL78088.1 hypothetical protein Ae168Ps1_0494 [Pseudonocardia sp. Ae168_Ps1]OLL87788.1 hypothetical protein Ae263Ps1_4843c [Pseudonocardia sp. Ae263_Ps1]OLL92186.1 hypothetical protein Ae356Ps1_2083 [Pseudonocardia sp. Ae356_Ps1]
MTHPTVVPEDMMTRKIVDCREMPSESGCTLTLTGEEAEVLDAACGHAVAVHGHTDGPELRDAIRAGMRTAPLDAADGSFVQMIEFDTNRIEDMDGLVEEWMREIGTERTAQWYVVAEDRERPGTYVEVVGFPSHELAMRNSDHPATTRIAERMQKIATGEPTFRNLDVVRARTP